MALSTLSFSAAMPMGPQRRQRADEGSEMFSRTERCMSRASARSPGT
jgi:hypothetical protein